MIRRPLIAMVAVGALLVAGCADDDATDTTVTTAMDQEQDRDRDRDRIHQTLATTLDACGEQDRDRVRTQLQDQLRERLDAAGYRYGAGTSFEVVDEEYRFDGEQATVQTRLRIQERDQEQTEARLQWQFEQTDEGWQLSELPPCLVDGATPSTSQDQDRDQDQDRERDQDRDPAG